MLFISRWVYKWGGGNLYPGELIIGGIFLLFISRWVYKWGGGNLYPGELIIGGGFFYCLLVDGYISGGDLYPGELIIGGIFLLFISSWVYKWGGLISGGAYNRRYFFVVYW